MHDSQYRVLTCCIQLNFVICLVNKLYVYTDLDDKRFVEYNHCIEVTTNDAIVAGISNMMPYWLKYMTGFGKIEESFSFCAKKLVQLVSDDYQTFITNNNSNNCEMTSLASFYFNDNEYKIKTNDKKIIINVLDEGQGFKEKDTEKIFKRFYSNRPDKFGQHSGLGLNIVKNLVHLHNGSIKASNRTDQKGASMEIIFPKV